MTCLESERRKKVFGSYCYVYGLVLSPFKKKKKKKLGSFQYHEQFFQNPTWQNER
jgi:hypothetical protein